MGLYTVEVQVSTDRPIRNDGTIFFQIEAESAIAAEIIAAQWAGSHSGVVMPIDILTTDWPEDE